MYKLWLEDTSFTLVSELVNRKKKKKSMEQVEGLVWGGRNMSRTPFNSPEWSDWKFYFKKKRASCTDADRKKRATIRKRIFFSKK